MPNKNVEIALPLVFKFEVSVSVHSQFVTFMKLICPH